MKIISRGFILTIMISFAVASPATSAEGPANVYQRTSLSLNGTWHYIVDPYENGFYNYRYEPYDNEKNPGNGAYFKNAKPKDRSDLVEYDFDRSDTITVPGDWNTQKERLYYYEGTVWYKRSFDYRKSDPSHRVYICFGGANYQADVYLNGTKLGRHVGGFTPFAFDATNVLRENGNFLIVKVDNKRMREGVPTLNTDWWNYGGITRDVRIIEVQETYINDYMIQLDPENNKRITGTVSVSGSNISGTSVRVEIPELRLRKDVVTDSAGKASLDFVSSAISYWTPEHPRLYDVRVSAGSDVIVDRIGFRTIRTHGEDILLNGEKVFLRLYPS